MLQLVEIVFNLFGIELSRKTLKMQGNSSHMAAVVIKSTGASAQDGNVALKALEQKLKACNFTAGTVEVLVIP